jgi:glycosyltransferase involved in cell wall biosynthesis
MWSGIRNRVYGLSRGSRINNWIPPSEISNLFEQTGFEIVQQRSAVILPFHIPFLSRVANRWLSQMPILRHFSVFNIVTVRPKLREITSDPKVSIIVAARNEAGNIQSLIDRLPSLSASQELIFVEGGSDDSTWETIQAAISQNQDRSGLTISAYKQTGKGKGDAVRLGFSKATGEILIILDADLSVPPEELPRFIENLKNDNCEFANGSRLVYPMEDKAMQFLNLIGNRLFGIVFSFLIGQSVRDTLCGTKAMWAEDYYRLASQREYFGDFDPFGDFDLLFGASRLGLKIRDIPVHYKERVYGSTNISRFRHGLLLLKMTAFAAKRLKFVK